MGGKRDARKKKAKQTGEKKVAKNPTKEKSKKKSKSDEPVEDIDALLETFRRQQLETFAVHHEANCDPPSRFVCHCYPFTVLFSLSFAPSLSVSDI